MRYLIILFVLLSGTIHAGTLEKFKFDDPQQTQDFRDLSSELRCLVCQNESLAGSGAELAQDLRQEVYEMMVDGKSKQEIKDFMVARYGDFILFDPPLKKSTVLLWFGPIILLIIASFMLVRALRKQSESKPADLSAEELKKVRELLNTKDTK